MDLNPESIAAIAAGIAAAGAAATKIVRELADVRRQMNGGDDELTMREMLHDVHHLTRANTRQLEAHSTRLEAYGSRLVQVENVLSIPPLQEPRKH